MPSCTAVKLFTPVVLGSRLLPGVCPSAWIGDTSEGISCLDGGTSSPVVGTSGILPVFPPHHYL